MRTERVNGIELALVDRGSGLPVVLVHGSPLDHSMWNAQIDALAGYCRVIAPDLRGFGQSGVSQGAVSMEQFGDDLAALLDALGIGEPAVLCGLSMGGYVALAFWRKYRARLRGLVLCDTRAGADSPEAAAAREVTAQRVLDEGPAPLADAMLPKLFAPATVAERPEVAESVRRVIEGTDPQGIAAAALGMGERPDMTPSLSEIRCPSLVIVGQNDALSTPEEMRKMAGAIGAARFVEVPGAGHLAPLEKPDEVNAALGEFLEPLMATGTSTGS